MVIYSGYTSSKESDGGDKMSDETLTIEMQSRPREEDARCLSSDYDGPGFWEWNGERYIWNDNKPDDVLLSEDLA
jgi:hypothetical protein